MTNAEKRLRAVLPDETIKLGQRLTKEQVSILNGIIFELKYKRKEGSATE